MLGFAGATFSDLSQEEYAMQVQSALRMSVAVLILFLPFCMIAKDPEFSGSLQRVTHVAISILLSDGALVDARIPAKGDLSADAIVSRYTLADQVQVTRKSNLALKSLRLLRHPSEQERTQVIASLTWRR